MTDLPSRQSGVHFRKPTEPPTKEGWYYGRFAPPSSALHIIPIWVEIQQGQVKAFCQLAGAYRITNDYIWFGPVAEVVEG